MAIKYCVSGCSNPAGQTGVEYACCKVVQQHPFTSLDIVKNIERDTSYTRADIVGVVTALREYIRTALLAGQHVDLKDGVTNLGIVSPNVKSRCFRQTAIQAQGFNPQGYITGAGVKMRPSNEIKTAVRLSASLERVSSDLME